MARVTGSQGANWPLIVLIIILIIIIAALAFAYFAPDQVSQFVPGLRVGR